MARGEDAGADLKGQEHVERLLTRGGWELDDVQTRHRANPDSFWLPGHDDLSKVAPGSCARVIITVLDQADQARDGIDPYDETGNPNLVRTHERVWLWVEESDGDELIGIMHNMPVATHTRLVPGARLRFRRDDVIDIDLEPATPMAEFLTHMESRGFPALDEGTVLAPEDPTRPPRLPKSQAQVCERLGLRPERPAPFVGCLLDRAAASNTWPLYGVRSQPRHHRGDCGWTIWSQQPDAHDIADRIEVVHVMHVRNRDLAAWRYLALPPGWAFVIDDPAGYEDVYQDPTAIED